MVTSTIPNQYHWKYQEMHFIYYQCNIIVLDDEKTLHAFFLETEGTYLGPRMHYHVCGQMVYDYLS